MPLLFLFLFSFFIINSSIVSATYTGIGYNDFVMGSGIFDGNATVTGATKSISSPTNVPTIADLNNDGTNEIILIDGTTLRIYQNTTLDIVDAYSPLNVSGKVNYVLFDIDNDNLTEIILTSSGSGDVDIIEYNTTHTYLQRSFALTGHESGEAMVGCKTTEQCVAVFVHQITANDEELSAVAFNSTTTGSVLSLKGPGASETARCFPHIAYIEVADYDNDADSEMIFSHNEMKGSTGTDEVHIIYLRINETLGVVNEKDISITSVYDAWGGGNNPGCTINHQRYFTSPLVYNFDGATSNGLETIIAFSEDNNEFVMQSFDKTGTKIDDYPEIFQADGEIVSNVMRTNAFSDTGIEDFCVVGYDNTDEELDILCASMTTGKTPQTREFILDVSDYYDGNISYNTYNVISHTAQHDDSLTDSTDLSEIVTTYGIGRLNWDRVCRTQIGANIYCYDLLYENPKGPGVVISDDVMNTSRDDLLILTSTNLWYMDDSYVNTPPTLTNYYFNPCLDGVWKQNTTVEMRAKVNDADDDTVRVKFNLYENQPFNKTSGWSSNVSEDTTFTASFTADNVTGSGYIASIEYSDTGSNAIIKSNYTFSVGLNGFEFNDCTTDVTVTTTTETNLTTELNLTASQSADIRATFRLGLASQYNVPVAFGWIMLFSIMIFVGMWKSKINNPTIYVWTTGLVVTMGMLLFTWMGMLPSWILITTIFICCAIAGFKIYQGFHGGDGNVGNGGGF